MRKSGQSPKILWTPWRLPFILGPKNTGCIFCDKPSEDRDESNFILYRGKHCFIMLNAYPYTNGHLLVAPYAHVNSTELLQEEALAEIMLAVNRGLGALRQSMTPAGFNIGVNMGAVAGAGIADHVHVHIVPRWQGDTNFLPVLDGTRMIPETLESTFQRLLLAGIAD